MKKILVTGPSWVGDCMLMQPMLMRIKQRYPDCLIDILAPAWTAGLLDALPEVHQVIVNPFPHGELNIMGRYQLGVQLRAAQYDQAIVLPNSLKSALVPFFARIPLRTGFVGEMRYGLLNDARKLDKTILPLMVERFAQLAEARGASIPRPLSNPRLTVPAGKLEASLQKLGLTLNQPVAIFCPGAEYGPAKRWPVAYFAQTAQRLHDTGYQVWLMGSAKDREVAEKIVALGNPATRNLCGSTDLTDAIALLSCADLVISNDSGLMHLAAALDRPMLALFGSSSPQFTPPLSAHATVVKLDIECSPCFKRVCPLGHFNCMNQLTPDRVWEKIEQLIA
ncbi:MAG: lipopolysaccharide heptosyltransferase II [Gallionella sp.]|nr:lipopolysaccharide heptosyltransferase II [Gallionella sp.]